MGQPMSAEIFFAVSMELSASGQFRPMWRTSKPSILSTAERVRSVMRCQSFAATASFGTIQEPPQQRILSNAR